MAKKRFTEGMETLFKDSGQPTDQLAARGALSLFPDDTAANHDAERRGHSKGFTSQLDALLAEAFEAITHEESPDSTTHPADTSSARRPRGGLDLLIRSTTDAADNAAAAQAHTTRRVTLVFPKEQLEKLKEVAKARNLYLKDIINDLVAQYLAKQGW